LLPGLDGRRSLLVLAGLAILARLGELRHRRPDLLAGRWELALGPERLEQTRDLSGDPVLPDLVRRNRLKGRPSRLLAGGRRSEPLLGLVPPGGLVALVAGGVDLLDNEGDDRNGH
jgi:hypothetical protein